MIASFFPRLTVLRPLVALALSLAVASVPQPGRAQRAASLTLGCGSGSAPAPAGSSVFAGSIRAVQRQADGKIVVLGDFLTATGNTHYARFNADGTPDGTGRSPRTRAAVAATGTVQFSSPGGYPVGEGAGNAVLAVTRVGGSLGEVTVAYQTFADTATAGQDYASTYEASSGGFGLITFADGDTQPKSISIPIIDDSIPERSETFFVVLFPFSDNAALGNASQATVTILDNDSASGNGAPSTFQFSSPAFTEFESSPAAVITVTRNPGGANFNPVFVAYTTSDGTARAGVNYIPASGFLGWEANDFTPKTFAVPLLRDGIPTDNLTVNLDLQGTSGNAAVGAPAHAVLTITDVDSPAVLGFSAPEYLVAEDGVAAVVNVTRTGGSGTAVAVTFTTVDGSARAGVRYLGVNGTLSWAAGDTSARSIVIPILNDDLPELDQTVLLLLGEPQGNAVIGPQGEATLVIRDDEGGGSFPFVTIAATDPLAKADGSVKGTFTVARTGDDPSRDLTVNYAVRGTAANGREYRLLNGVVTIPAGSATARIRVKAINGGGDDGQGTVKLILRDGSGYFAGAPNTAKVRIVP